MSNICHTDIDNLKDVIEQKKEEENEDAIILDLSLDIEKRIKTYENYCKKYGNESLEITYKLASMYSFSGISLLEKYLFDLCFSNIPTHIKIILAKSLIEGNVEKGYIVLNNICNNLKDIPTPVKVDTIKLLLPSDEYKTKSLSYLYNILKDQSIDCKYRYGTIMSIEKINFSYELKSYYLINSCFSFLKNSENMTMYRILSGQYLLSNYEKDLEQRDEVENFLLSFASDQELDYNLRADAADVMLSLAESSTNRDIARNIIIELGSIDGFKPKTIYENAQNVHTENFEKSILEALEYLSSIKVPEKITFDIIRGEITKVFDKEKRKEDKDYDKECKCIELALNRIQYDNVLYSRYNFTLSGVLCHIWCYIKNHEHKEEIMKRLYEELIEMSGTCSTGYISRLINTISGFGDFNYKISWSDQITSIFIAKLNSRAKLIQKIWIDDEHLIMILKNIFAEIDGLKSMITQHHIIRKQFGKVPSDMSDYINLKKQIKPSSEVITDKELLEEFLIGYNKYKEREGLIDEDRDYMIEHIVEDFENNVMLEMSDLEKSDELSKLNFSTFLVDSLPCIKEEMWKEYKDHIEDSEFDMCMRKALSVYDNTRIV